MRLLLALFYLLFYSGSYFLMAEERVLSVSSMAVNDETWNWLPEWRDKADCGPNALYVLINLEGRPVTLEDVKKLVRLDPKTGCSMDLIIKAANQLGFAIEARFVKPGDVHKLHCPFILHGITSREKNLGHFIVVAGFDKKTRNFALIDPVRETFGWNPEESVLYGYSGYVLVPKYPVARMWNRLAGMSLILCGIGIVSVILIRAYYK